MVNKCRYVKTTFIENAEIPTEMKKELLRLGCTNLGDFAHLKFEVLMRNKVILKYWDVLPELLWKIKVSDYQSTVRGGR